MKKILLDREEMHRGTLILVNEKYGTAYDAPSELAVVGKNIRLERQAWGLLDQLMREIGGWDFILPVSGWRSWKEQQSIWDESMRENGEEYTVYIRQFDSPVHPCCIRLGGRAVYVSYAAADTGQTALWVNETAPYYISGNNVDGFVLTQWQQGGNCHG